MFESHKEGQYEFADAIEKSGCTFLDYQMFQEKQDATYPDQAERLQIMDRVRIQADPSDMAGERFSDALPPNPILASKAAGIGFANVVPDNDFVNRKMPLVTKLNGYYYPNIDLVVLMKYYGISINDVEIKIGKYIKLKNIPAEKMTKPNNEHTITIPIDKSGSMFINFIGVTGAYTHFPYYYFASDASMEGNDSFKDKIALIAAYSTGMAEDVHDSPYGKMFGIEHHASALNTIINQDFIINFSDMQNVLLLLAISLFLGYLLPRSSIIWSVIIVILGALGFIFASYLLFDSKNVVMAFASPLMLIGIDFALITALRVLTEQKEKRFIRQSFSKFVTKSVVDELLKHPEKIKLGGEKKILTVLFSDVRGFTSLSERLTPETARGTS